VYQNYEKTPRGLFCLCLRMYCLNEYYVYMQNPEQVKAPDYPETESVIALSPMERGYIEAGFILAIDSHGNGDECTWESYAENDYEVFTLKKYGLSSVSPDETDYWQTYKWTIKFGARKKTLLIDMGSGVTERYEGEFTVPASFIDISDVVAAHFNLQHLSNERRKQGWSPLTDFLFKKHLDELREDSSRSD